MQTGNVKLKEKYLKEVIPGMISKFGYKNKMAVPKLEKVTINTGFGKMIANKSANEQTKNQEAILGDIALITGQRPVIRKAKKSIAGFKLRKGMPVGASVVLRGAKMYDFLEKLINIGLPRTRDFRGIKNSSLDNSGNLSIGIKEHIIFPEISPEKVKFIFGFEIVITTTTKNKEEGEELLKLLGFPLKS